MEQRRDGGTCARNLSLTMLGHVWHTHIPKCLLLHGGAPPYARRGAPRRGRHDGRHGTQLYRLLLCAGARLPPRLEVVDVEEVPTCKASESACQGRTERGEPGASGGASERLEGVERATPHGMALCTAWPSVGSLPWSPEGGRAWWEAGLSRGRPDVLGGGGACSRDACSLGTSEHAAAA